jgi:hypothetical protein
MKQLIERIVHCNNAINNAFICLKELLIERKNEKRVYGIIFD